MSLVDQLEAKREQPGKDDQRVIHFAVRGYMIMVGQNSLSNERLVSTHEHEDCLWFHAVGAKGSHVVLCHTGSSQNEFPDEVVKEAAKLALKHSKSTARSVRFARVGSVLKPGEGSLGSFYSPNAVQVEV